MSSPTARPAVQPVSWDESLAGALVDAMPLGVVVVGGAREVLRANPAAVALGAVTPEMTLAVRELEVLVQECSERGAAEPIEVALPGPIEAPLRRPRPDRDRTVVRVRALMVSPRAVALLLEDLTDQRRVDAVRSDFVANVSHELKTPVGAMHLLAEAIGESSDDQDTVRRFAVRMVTESRRLGNLVQELIDLSRLESAEPLRLHEDVSMASVVTEAIDRVRTIAAAKEIEVAVLGDIDIQVRGDVGQLVMAVSNLLDNAVSYSPDRTRVVVSVSRSGGQVKITVRDEGIGISAKHQERIFERFFRVDPARSRLTGGTGLGLSIVKHVATNHGGTVSVWSSEGSGSTFTLQWPSPQDPSAPTGTDQ